MEIHEKRRREMDDAVEKIDRKTAVYQDLEKEAQRKITEVRTNALIEKEHKRLYAEAIG